MNIFMIGGTGLLGSESAKELIKRGHTVKTMSLPPLPVGAELPPEMEIELGDFNKLSDDELKERFEGVDAFIFAAGVDERVEGAPPIYDVFYKFNIEPLERVLPIAKECGVKHAVIFGSYFSHFAKIREKDELTKYHPYIRSRIDQENTALSFADDTFDVSILELPYIFGTQPGRKPVWVFLVESILSMKDKTMYPKGGTTMVTVRQVAMSCAGALENTKGGACYPIGYYNLAWTEMLAIFHKYMGCPEKKIKTIPTWMYKLGAKQTKKQVEAAGHESGLDPIEFTKLQCSNLFIDKDLACTKLGVTEDDIDKAIGESVKLSLDIINGELNDFVDMKGE